MFLTTALYCLYSCGAPIVRQHHSKGLTDSSHLDSSPRKSSTGVASVHRDAELFAQDCHSKWPGQELNQGLFGSRDHAPNLYITPLVFACLGFQAHRSLCFLSGSELLERMACVPSPFPLSPGNGPAL